MQVRVKAFLLGADTGNVSLLAITPRGESWSVVAGRFDITIESNTDEIGKPRRIVLDPPFDAPEGKHMIRTLDV